MPFINFEVTDQLNEEFRTAILKKFGNKKGSLQQAGVEAIKLWLKQEKANS